MMAPGMRANVARSAKPVARRKYFPNLLIFDSPFFFRLKLGFVNEAWCRFRLSSSEGAVPRIWGVNPTRLTCWNEPESNDLCHDIAFVSDDVYVASTTIDKCHPRCVHVRRAVGIVPVIMSYRSCRDDD